MIWKEINQAEIDWFLMSVFDFGILFNLFSEEINTLKIDITVKTNDINEKKNTIQQVGNHGDLIYIVSEGCSKALGMYFFFEGIRHLTILWFPEDKTEIIWMSCGRAYSWRVNLPSFIWILFGEQYMQIDYVGILLVFPVPRTGLFSVKNR